MDSRDFLALVREKVADRFNERFDLHLPGERKEMGEVFIVWSSKVLKNNKALAAVDGGNGMYYEVTYNGETNELYIDEYVKAKNVKIVGN